MAAAGALYITCLTRRRVALIVLASLGLCYHVNFLSISGDSDFLISSRSLFAALSPEATASDDVVQPNSLPSPAGQQHKPLHHAVGNRTTSLSSLRCNRWASGVGGAATAAGVAGSPVAGVATTGASTAGATEAAPRSPYQPYLKIVAKRAFEEMQSNDLVPDLISFCSGEEPARVSVLLTTWRTGSTLIGSVLSKHPALAYHYEPMTRLGLQQARDGDLLQQAAHSLQQLAHCNTTEQYIDVSRRQEYVPKADRFWNELCKDIKGKKKSQHWCWNSRFLREFCQLFPYRLIKLVRVRLHALQQMLVENDSVRVLVTGRDPRATKHSRRNPFFCRGRRNCDDPGLCSDMVNDYHTALNYNKAFPGRVRLIRYEDIIDKPMEQFQNITSFFGIHFTEVMKATVTKSINGTTKTVQRSKGERIQAPSETYSTVRDAEFEMTQWRREMSWQSVQRIQDNCEEAMKLWGYNMATSEQHLRTFDPVGRFDLGVR